MKLAVIGSRGFNDFELLQTEPEPKPRNEHMKKNKSGKQQKRGRKKAK